MRTTPTEAESVDFSGFDDDELIINKFELDRECVEQPQLFQKYSKLLAEAQKCYEKMKVDGDVMEASLDAEIRLDPKKFGLTKITETGIKNAVKLQTEWNTFQDQLIDAKHTTSILQGVVRAFDQKKKMIESLVQLHGQEYYSTVEVKGNRDFVKNAKQSMVREKVKNRNERK